LAWSSGVKEVDFTSDYAAFYNYTVNYAGANTTPFSPRGWRANPPANNPVVHVMGRKISLNATMQVQPCGISFNLIGTGSSGATSFSASNITSTGDDQIVPLTANNSLPNQIDVISTGIQWQVLTSTASCNAGTSGSHTIYVVWDSPFNSSATLKRIDWACNQVKGQALVTLTRSKLHCTIL
jgi:hypothetical protein